MYTLVSCWSSFRLGHYSYSLKFRYIFHSDHWCRAQRCFHRWRMMIGRLVTAVCFQVWLNVRHWIFLRQTGFALAHIYGELWVWGTILFAIWQEHKGYFHFLEMYGFAFGELSPAKHSNSTEMIKRAPVCFYFYYFHSYMHKYYKYFQYETSKFFCLITCPQAH